MALARYAPDDEVPVAADVLGSFGVTPADVKSEPASTDALEAALADALASDRDRTAVLRRTIARSDRGVACAARYSPAALERELTAVFEAIGWSLTVTATGDGLRLAAADPRGRRREATVTYPETPLGTDNLPAVLWTIDDALLAGTDARFVLLSTGVDRWRAALVDEAALERLREAYGPRIDAFERPLLPDRGLGAYVPDATASSDVTATDDDGPWPPWALEGRGRRTDPSAERVDDLIDEAEPAGRSASGAAAETDSSDGTSASASPAGADSAAPSPESTAVDGFELRGTPSVSRRRDGTDATTAPDPASGDDSTRGDRSASAGESGSECGALSGTSETARVDNDSFGADVGRRTDRYGALGAALDAGGAVSVRGLLEDDEFLPELPAAEPATVRIEYPDECAPVDGPETAAAAEADGFEWVDAGDLERTRLSGE